MIDMKRKIDYIVIHCTATEQGATVGAIQNYWKNTLGWKSPGYHVLIDSNGTANYLQSFDSPTNGVKGFNSNSIHISYIGGKDFDDRTDMQKQVILRVIKEALEYSMPHIPIIQGHRDFRDVKKACPQFNAKDEYKHLRGQ